MNFADELLPFYFYSPRFGDNCFPFILRIAKNRDIKMDVYHLFRLQDVPLNITVENDGRVLKTVEDYHEAWFDYSHLRPKFDEEEEG